MAGFEVITYGRFWVITEAIPNRWDAEKEQLDWILVGNGYLAKLLPQVSVEDQWGLLEASIQRTIRPMPKDKKQADEWLKTNRVCGDALLDEFTSPSRPAVKRFSIGGFAYVQGIMNPWSVVLYVDETKVALWDFEFNDGRAPKERCFLHSVAVPATAISSIVPGESSPHHAMLVR